MKNVLVSVLFVLFLCGCNQVGVYNTISTSKLFSENDIEWTTGKLVIGVSTQKEFIRSKDFLNKLFSKYFLEIKEFEYQEKGLSSFAVAQIKTPILKEQTTVNSMFNFVFTNNRIGVLLNKEYYFNFKQEFEEAFSYGKISIKDITFAVQLENDSMNNFNLKYAPNYINNEPITYFPTSILETDERTIIQLSNVSLDYCLGNDDYIFLQVKKEE